MEWPRGLMKQGWITAWMLLGLFCLALDIQASTEEEKSNYRLRAQDLLQFEMSEEPELKKELRIAADGNIILPYIQSVRVAGLTLSEAQQLITKRYYEEEFYVNPQVHLFVLKFASRSVYVLGEVKVPGAVDIPPSDDLTLTKAISAAGGLTRMGAGHRILLKRTQAGKEITVMKLNFKDIMKDKRVNDVTLQEGDKILVEEIRI